LGTVVPRTPGDQRDIGRDVRHADDRTPVRLARAPEIPIGGRRAETALIDQA
jgi:hypothetical protein